MKPVIYAANVSEARTASPVEGELCLFLLSVSVQEELAAGNEYVKALTLKHCGRLALLPSHPVQAVQDFAKETGDQVVVVSAQVEAFGLAPSFNSEAARHCAFVCSDPVAG